MTVKVHCCLILELNIIISFCFNNYGLSSVDASSGVYQLQTAYGAISRNGRFAKLVLADIMVR